MVLLLPTNTKQDQPITSHLVTSYTFNTLLDRNNPVSDMGQEITEKQEAAGAEDVEQFLHDEELSDFLFLLQESAELHFCLQKGLSSSVATCMPQSFVDNPSFAGGWKS